MLCQACLRIFRGRCPHKTSKHHSLPSQLRRAALDGCPVCRVLWQITYSQTPETSEGICKDPDAAVPTPRPISQYYIQHKSTCSRDNVHDISELKFSVDQYNTGDGCTSVTFCLQPMHKATSILPTEGPLSSIDWSTSMISAKKWLDQCSATHARCQSAGSSTFTKRTPTRLLHIEQRSSSKIRLLLHPQEDTHTPYATLSHCWGASRVLRLTSETSQRLIEGVAPSELGQTFQNAIFTARALGIQFLWIDSLCIFQDSHEDWLHEASLMSGVYRHAILNVAATVAADGESPCFLDRRPWSVRPCVLQTKWLDCRNDSYHLYHDGFWYYAFNDMPLMKRAWVCQELLLAQRVLYLNGTQLFWECSGLAACETYPGGIPPNLRPDYIPRTTKFDAIRFAEFSSSVAKFPETLSRDELKKLWIGILGSYTRCNLTCTSDKLIALSGIAKFMERAFNDKYCAGLWRKNLVTDLLWLRACPEQGLRPRPEPYRAPSWSWASLDGPISLALYDEAFYRTMRPLIDVVDCTIDNRTGDTTGNVAGGVLKLSGWLSTIQLDEDFKRNGRVFFNGKWWEEHPNFWVRLDCQVSNLKLLCLTVLADVQQLPDWNAWCLLLGATGNSKGQFERSGLRTPKNENWLEYEGIRDDGQYLVSII